ncbi:nuclear transport factor 2 family protein [Luteimonas mephitis]|uniref:nuclear transport factor 2 family protein n=1 Tax=Luteimonas mephitis TaxID=83615 RepID=UPI0012EC79B7|nr:nuclear transport factor 2 family protein [Luteimonas mephitis]
MKEQDFWQLEEQFWTSGADFYDQRLGRNALMVFPEPAGVLDRKATLESLQSGARWKNVSFTNKKFAMPAQSTAVLVYSVQADRGGSGTAYSAQCSSTYVHSSGDWQLALHQQTPTD